MDVKTKREREKETVSLMIRLYCRKKHGGKDLCPDCAALDAYARQRSDKCPFMETKTFCSNCKVHCYKKDMRESLSEGYPALAGRLHTRYSPVRRSPSILAS